jgi:hypothetical protein
VPLVVNHGTFTWLTNGQTHEVRAAAKVVGAPGAKRHASRRIDALLGRDSRDGDDMEGPVGFEPTTRGLKVPCSAAELRAPEKCARFRQVIATHTNAPAGPLREQGPPLEPEEYRHGMFGPMYDPKVSVFGLPAEVLIFALGVTGSVIGLLWMRSITHDEPERTSFRAMADRTFVPPLSMIAGTALLGLVMMFLGAMAIGSWLVIGGVALEVVAAALLARRLWDRSRA